MYEDFRLMVTYNNKEISITLFDSKREVSNIEICTVDEISPNKTVKRGRNIDQTRVF